MAETISIEGQRQDGVISLLIAGELTCATQSVVRATEIEGLALEDYLRSGTQVGFDLSKIGYIDSIGVGQLLTWLRACQSLGIPTKLAAASEPVRRVIRVTGLCRMFSLNPCL